jgi:hypothetical protein
MGQCFSSGQALDEQARYAEQVMKDVRGLLLILMIYKGTG